MTTAAPDYSAKAEAMLVGSPRSPLRRDFQTSELAVYEVPKPRPIITGPARAHMVAMTESRIVARIGGPGTYRIAVRFSRYWEPSIGCAVRGPDGMIRLTVPRAGLVRLAFSPDAGAALAALTGHAARSCAG